MEEIALEYVLVERSNGKRSVGYESALTKKDEMFSLQNEDEDERDKTRDEVSID